MANNDKEIKDNKKEIEDIELKEKPKEVKTYGDPVCEVNFD